MLPVLWAQALYEASREFLTGDNTRIKARRNPARMTIPKPEWNLVIITSIDTVMTLATAKKSVFIDFAIGGRWIPAEVVCHMTIAVVRNYMRWRMIKIKAVDFGNVMADTFINYKKGMYP